jgi:hypothetical protein
VSLVSAAFLSAWVMIAPPNPDESGPATTQLSAPATSPPAVPASPPSESAPSPTPAPPPIDVEMSIRAAYQAAQNLQGPLDGRWRLSAADGDPLYVFQLTDPGHAPAPRASTPWNPAVEGAWRDLKRPGADGSGLLSAVDRDGATISIRFARREGDAPTVVVLHPTADGAWAGELSADGARRAVVMSRF